MPRNGDGSSDNGPIEAKDNIIIGNSGDDTIKHTQKVAPLPEGEKGEALPGLSASGGGADVTKVQGTNSDAKDAK